MNDRQRRELFGNKRDFSQALGITTPNIQLQKVAQRVVETGETATGPSDPRNPCGWVPGDFSHSGMGCSSSPYKPGPVGRVGWFHRTQDRSRWTTPRSTFAEVTGVPRGFIPQLHYPTQSAPVCTAPLGSSATVFPEASTLVSSGRNAWPEQGHSARIVCLSLAQSALPA